MYVPVTWIKKRQTSVIRNRNIFINYIKNIMPNVSKDKYSSKLIVKPQAASSKLQAPSVRQIDAGQYALLTQAPSTKLQATSTKRQATWLNFFWISDHESASGQLVRWPSVERSRTREPGKSFTHLWPRALIRIKVFLGWDKWKAIWWGENLTRLPFVTFNSTVKKWLELL